MSYIQPKPRMQLMMPCSIDDYVSCESYVRFIDAFVDKIVQIQPELLTVKGTSDVGRTAYKFSTLLKLYIYGFLNSVSSSRKLEAETYRNMEVIWLLGNLQPDHKTISDFRKDNKEAIRSVTISFRRFLKDEGYISGKKNVYRRHQNKSLRKQKYTFFENHQSTDGALGSPIRQISD